MKRTKRLEGFFLLFFLFLSNLPVQAINSKTINPEDTVKTAIGRFLNFRDSVFRFNFRSLHQTALNANRIERLSFQGDNRNQYKFNSSVQMYFDEFTLPVDLDLGLEAEMNILLNRLDTEQSTKLAKTVAGYVSKLPEKEVLYAIWRKNIVHVETEKAMRENMRQNTHEMLSMGFDDLENDLLPFITMLIWEQKVYHYQNYRVISTKPESKGIITSIQILNALESLSRDEIAGVCRDVHDWGLRMLRPMLTEYYNYKNPDKDYNVDDYLFLQAWVTPSSQHVIIAVVDPENPRNYYELDWGSLLKKENQEGVEIGKMVGTTVRLWQYQPEKDLTQAFNLVRTQWGTFFDKRFFKSDEDWLFNGIYTPDYSSSVDYILSAGKKSELNVSLAMLNASEKAFSVNFRSGDHRFSIANFLEYSGLVGIQSMIIDDTQRKNNTMAWEEWYNAINWANSVRYILNLKTKDIEILPNLRANIYALSQIEFFLSASYFKTAGAEFNNHLEGSGDGNIWLTWGGKLNYSLNNFQFDAKFGSRNFLISNDVRLLSPNPFELIRNATVANSGNGLLLHAAFDDKNWLIEPEFRFEQNKLNAQFTLYALKFAKNIKKSNNRLFFKGGIYNQIKGIEYYWYAKSRFWSEIGINSAKNAFDISLYSELIKGDFISFGLQFNKYLN